jgi:hypothetical protein
LYTGAGARETANGFWKLCQKTTCLCGKREGKLELCVHATETCERLFGLRNGLSVQRIASPRLLSTGKKGDMNGIVSVNDVSVVIVIDMKEESMQQAKLGLTSITTSTFR